MTANEKKQLMTMACKVRMGVVTGTSQPKQVTLAAACLPRMCSPTSIPRN